MSSFPPPYSLPKLRHLLPQHQQKHGETPRRETDPGILVSFLFGCIPKAIFAEPMQLGTVGVVTRVAWEVSCFRGNVVSQWRFYPVSSLPGSNPENIGKKSKVSKSGYRRSVEIRPDVCVLPMSVFLGTTKLHIHNGNSFLVGGFNPFEKY